MATFNDWDGVIGAQGVSEALLAYGRAKGEISPKGKLPKDDLKPMASAAILTGERLFSLEDARRDRGSCYVHAFAGYHWAYDSRGISGPFYSLESAAKSILRIASLAAPAGFYASATCALGDDFIASRAVNLVDVGETFVINGSAYVRTDAGLVKK